MLPPCHDPLAEAIASQAAASLWNVLDIVMKLPAPQAFERIKLHVEGAITAYKRSERRVFPAPSDN
jgi:hypothetical protein